MPPVAVLVPFVLAADEKESEGDGMKCVVCGKEFTSEIKQRRLEEACRQDEDAATIQYWVGYLDGLRAAEKEHGTHS